MEVKVSGLRKYFGTTRAVDDISFSFGSGDIVGFVGPNGAGKTTTIKMMVTLEEPTSGDIFFDGVSMVEEPEKVRKLVGYMPDALPTLKDMTVHEYLDFFGRAYEIPGSQRRKVITDIEEFTNLSGIREKFLNALSKGMKQRVSLARALIHNPDILIMDEPAAGLDPRARVELRELLRVLSEQGKAIFLSSHILTELAEICTRVVIIEQGKLLRAGTLNELSKDEQKPHTTVFIRTLNDVEGLYKEALQLPHVATARKWGEIVVVDVIGNDQQCCELLQILLQRQHKIVEFHQEKTRLEDIFMRITEGRVQ